MKAGSEPRLDALLERARAEKGLQMSLQMSQLGLAAP